MSAEPDICGAIEDDKEDEGYDSFADGPDREERDGVHDECQDENIERAESVGRGAEAEPPDQACDVITRDQAGALRGRKADRRRVRREEKGGHEKGENANGCAEEEQ